MGSLCKSGSLVEMNDSSELQHIYRGTAFATGELIGICGICLKVSIPLSRDSLCNMVFTSLFPMKVVSFNPSTEGQPLQHGVYLTISHEGGEFQSLYRGTAFATLLETNILVRLLKTSFNPSIEGQPLQPEKSFTELLEQGTFQSLYRGSAFATLRSMSITWARTGFNPSIEGQPLQRYRCITAYW